MLFVLIVQLCFFFIKIGQGYLLRAFFIIDDTDKIENVCSIDVTYWKSRGITVCSPPV